MLKMRFKKQIGSKTYEFEAEGSNLYEVITDSQKLSFPDVPQCGVCGSDNLILSSHIAQDKYKYAEVRCLECRATLNFGQKVEDPEVFYLRKTDGVFDWKQYTPKQK